MGVRRLSRGAVTLDCSEAEGIIEHFRMHNLWGKMMGCLPCTECTKVLGLIRI